jgi:RNA polymerase sigma factor (sigma-70 family)
MTVDFPSVLQAARLGAEWAWTALYCEVAPSVLRYLKAHGAPEPEDLLGDVFVQVVRKLADFEGGEDEFRAWVFTIARNRLFDEWRRHGRSRVDLTLDDPEAHHVTPVGNAEEDALRRLTDREVHAIIDQLAPQQRDVLFLRIFARLTVEEVALVVGSKPGAVKSLQTRAFAAIRRQIAKKAVTL